MGVGKRLSNLDVAFTSLDRVDESAYAFRASAVTGWYLIHQGTACE